VVTQRTVQFTTVGGTTGAPDFTCDFCRRPIALSDSGTEVGKRASMFWKINHRMITAGAAAGFAICPVVSVCWPKRKGSATRPSPVLVGWAAPATPRPSTASGAKSWRTDEYLSHFSYAGEWLPCFFVFDLL
jgi:hypothetical protein